MEITNVLPQVIHAEEENERCTRALEDLLARRHAPRSNAVSSNFSRS